MGIIAPVVDAVTDGMVYRWVGMLGNAVLEDCDVGEAIEVSSFTERSLQLSGPYNVNNRFVLDFNSDPDHMPWISIVPAIGTTLITPGRSYAASLMSVWPNTRFFRPRIASTYAPASAPVDVLLFCMNRVT